MSTVVDISSLKVNVSYSVCEELKSLTPSYLIGIFTPLKLCLAAVICNFKYENYSDLTK